MLTHDDALACIARRNERPVENKRAIREGLEADFQRFIASGGKVEQGVSRELRLVQSKTEDRRPIWVEAPRDVASRRTNAR